jgi:perosamine synthetase
LKIPFAKPFFSEDDETEIFSNIRAVLRSGWLTSGKNVESLENDFAETTGSKYAVAVNSCTAGLHSILMALKLKQTDEVIVPTNTFVATPNSVVYTGAKPVFADSDPETFNISARDVSRKISPKTKAIIAVHLAGNPCDMAELSDLASEHGIILLEDCAHAHGAKFRGENCGTFGLASAFSFYATKIMTSCEGGIVTTNDQKIAESVKRIRNQGRGGYGPLEITELGHNYRMSDVHAVIARNQLGHLPSFVKERQLIARKYDELLENTEWIQPQLVSNQDVCSYYVYLLKLSKGAPLSRDELVKSLGNDGIGTSVLYHPAHRQPLYKQMLDEDPACPVATELGETTFALPMFNGMTDEQFSYIQAKWRDAIGARTEQYATSV